ncbi:rab-GTPase-TBC domain-containing protein [Cokeromyces recurvatus]|uniref:rab-GTPase-TBC domain-containing protein n=1 Tax=Cokeromyces recurvatus TaxID=90255 RepID=UPI002220487E|nr:rab-GTPase-TBC domain-containing protein [Cokeromyces recurvatus]KAI7898655.1 rab-GTPase-TBC domain-containing protein [Cokeromyces recurvatus]
MEQKSTKSFWKRRGLKLPGSISIVPSWSSTSSNDTTEPIVIGARYTYNSLITTNDPSSKPVMLPSQYPTSQQQSLIKNSRVQSSNITTDSNLKDKQQPKKQTQVKNKSHQTSFKAFLKDTNDEWSDDIHEQQPLDITKKTDKDSEKTTKSTEALVCVAASQEDSSDTKQTLKVPKKKRLINPNGIKDNVNDLLLDPTYLLKRINLEETKDPTRTKKFMEVLSVSNVDLVTLRSLSWSGIPEELRMMAWQLLLGYLPCNSTRREITLARKRKEYSDSVAVTYARGTAGLDQALWHQIHIDIPRTNPGIPLYQCEATQSCLERILYQWAIRHPASGYVQGINDLVTPIFEVFLSAYIDEDPEYYDVSKLDTKVLDVIEADSFWCLSKLLDGIQDNYTFAQPGIQRQITILKELVSRIDARLTQHLQNEGIEFIQFAFRWMNCLLMRELPLRSTIRMWDTYLAEGSSEGFSEFHVYVCAAFLVKWSNQLQKLDFQGVMIFLQQLPTQGWQEKDIELLLSEAYMWKTLFHNAPNHLK